MMSLCNGLKSLQRFAATFALHSKVWDSIWHQRACKDRWRQIQSMDSASASHRHKKHWHYCCRFNKNVSSEYLHENDTLAKSTPRVCIGISSKSDQLSWWDLELRVNLARQVLVQKGAKLHVLLPEGFDLPEGLLPLLKQLVVLLEVGLQRTPYTETFRVYHVGALHPEFAFSL